MRVRAQHQEVGCGTVEKLSAPLSKTRASHGGAPRLRRRSRVPLMTLVSLALLAGRATGGESFEEKHARLLKENPAGVSLRISLADRAYRIGEATPVTLSFTNATDVQYICNGDEYRHMWQTERAFHVDGPAGSYDDPTATLLHWGVGGSRAQRDLRGLEVPVHLNEWVRFTKPGEYRIFCVAGVQEKEDWRKAHHVCSQIERVKIVPAGEEWTRRAVGEAIAGLKHEDIKARQAAARRLRYLGTPDALRALAPLLGEQDYWLTHHALYAFTSARDWDAARAMLERRLGESDMPVGIQYLSALRHLSLPRETYLFPQRSGDREEVDRRYEELHEKQAAVRKESLAKVAAALPAKRGRAAAVTGLLLLDNKIDTPGIRAAVARTFDLLGRGEQQGTLGYRWERVRCPQFEPVLAELARGPFTKEDRRSPLHRSWVVLRYREFRPAKARAIILEDIARPRPHLSVKALCSLPDEYLPELEDVLVRHLVEEGKGDVGKAAPLVERYATARSLPRVIARYRRSEGRWACSIQEEMLGYWIKHDRKAGLAAVIKAARLRKDTGCWQRVLGVVLARYYGSDAEEAVLPFLNDPEQRIVIDVIRLLRRKGTPACVEPLIAKLRELKGHALPRWTVDGWPQLGHVRGEIVQCLLEDHDKPGEARTRWQLTPAQQRAVWQLLNENEKKMYGSRFADLPESE